MSDGRVDPSINLEIVLENLGQLMAQQEAALETEPDPEFARSLRSRLTGEGQTVPVPARLPATRRLAVWARRYWMVGGGLAAVAAIALIVLIGGNRGGPSPLATPVQSAFRVPTPGSADLTKTYPLTGGLGSGGLPPVWSSSSQSPPGAPYAGHLTLRGHPFPSTSDRALAYRLAGPGFDVPRLRALATTLGIKGAIRHMTVGHDRWDYIANGTGPHQLHSVAVNRRTGELVYHDTRSTAPVPQRVTRVEQEVARRWLAQLGWPGRSMPWRQPVTTQEAMLPWIIRFNWPHVAADTPAASLTVDSTGRVTDAVLEPPVEAARSVPLRSRQAAWNALQQHGGPVGVEGMIGLPPKPGTATLTHAWEITVLTRAPDGRGYLVPSYRFEGTATIGGNRPKRWFAIVSAVK